MFAVVRHEEGDGIADVVGRRLTAEGRDVAGWLGLLRPPTGIDRAWRD
jgi:hypothetical protein